MAQCPGCGAAGGPSCEELFGRLLALDHSREEPWGPLHGVVVAAYRLQHERLAERDRTLLLELLRVFVDDGLEQANRLLESRVRSNSHRNRRPPPPSAGEGPRPGAFGATIAEVAAGGDFPAAGHPERVAAWAEAVLDAWGR